MSTGANGQSTDIPSVQCTGCERRVRCVRVSDGTIYRPLAWTFPDEARPLEGVCGSCVSATDDSEKAIPGALREIVIAAGTSEPSDAPMKRVFLGR